MKKISFEGFMKGVFMLCATTSILAIILICYFIFSGGVPFIMEYGLKILLGTSWNLVILHQPSAYYQ